MKHLLTSLALLTCAANAQTGLTSETWTNLTSNKSILTLRDEGISTSAPNTTQTVASSTVTALPANSGTRLRGTLTPPVDDTYTFWVNGADNVSLWLSEDGTRFTKRLIASHVGTTTSTEWKKYPSQKSLPITLSANTTYHIEAHVMSTTANGHLSIAWQGSAGNWALAANGATASQSSTMYGMTTAAMAVDGITDAGWNLNTLTQNIQNSWLKIDFAAVKSVDQIVLFNNTSSQNRLSNFRISVLDEQGVEVSGENFFTTSGNVGNSFTWNLPTAVDGKSVKIQLLGNNLAGNGHLALAEVQAFGPGPLSVTRDFQVIPGAYLAPVATNPADTNDNNLPDVWEQQTGLSTSTLPGALLEYGDPDKDGISNYDENYIGSNPLSVESLGDVITRARWMELQANLDGVSAITTGVNRSRFLSFPNEVTLTAGINYETSDRAFALRYRGSIVAPATGDYRFWLAGNGDAQFWISDGTVKDPATQQPLTNRFGKQLVATSGYTNLVRDYDQTPNQRSRSISMVQGQTYYIEVLQTQGQTNGNHVSLAWQPPGQSRAIVPATAFFANQPSTNDNEDDGLPDSWETTVGLNPANNGRANAGEGEYGDPDNDKLTNLQEYQNGTNPLSADTDGDGFSDRDEIMLYGSDPKISNNLAPVTVTLPTLNQYSNATGSWTTNSNGSISSLERRGDITYTFTIAQPGVHEVVLSAGAIHPYSWYTIKLPVGLSVDGVSIARATLFSQYGNAASLRAITPWLAAGTHTVTVNVEAYDAALRIRIDSLTLKRLGGADLDEDGIPDWLETKAALENKLTNIPTESRTSPVSVDGITQQIATTTLGVLPPGATTATNVPVTASINNTFFADVPLSATGVVTLNASMQSGLVTESHSITWIATNLLESFTNNTLHIRKGDALRLDAWSGASADAQPFTVTSNGTLLADPTNQNTTHTSGVPITATFTTAGSYTLVATHNSQTATVTVQVHEANFGASHLVQINTSRTWTPTALGASHVVESDERIVFAETTTTGARKFNVRTDKPFSRYVIARLPENVDGAPSAVLSRGTVHAFDLGLVDRTGDAQIVHRYDDGTWLMRSTIVAVNLPPGVTLRMILANQGTLFTNGSNILDLTAEDFDANGIAEIYYEYTGTTAPKLCHNIQVLYQP